ncbi:MAG: ATP-binding protein [Lentimicrobium sp.]|nr:ATP-binding protein [Lentimicrobium sp.]
MLNFTDLPKAPLDRNTKLTLLQLLDDRYRKRATIITSKLPVKSWYQYLDENLTWPM